MSGVPNNPPAFPRPGFDNPAGMEDGMTLRDYYAGQALPAVIAATSAGLHMPNQRPEDEHIRYAIARDAYDMADAMIAARKEGPTDAN